jgi:hypothetical protein
MKLRSLPTFDLSGRFSQWGYAVQSSILLCNRHAHGCFSLDSFVPFQEPEKTFEQGIGKVFPSPHKEVNAALL